MTNNTVTTVPETAPYAKLRLLHSIAILALTPLTAACGGGGGGGSSADQAGTPTDSTSATVGATGGTVSLQGLSLAVPANALATSTNVGLQKETVASPALVRFRFSPAGQTLASSAELRYSAANLPANARFFWEVNGEQWMIPGTVSGGVLTSQIASLGFTSAGTLLVVQQASAASGAASALSRMVSNLSGALAQAANASEGGSVVVQPVDCDTHITTLKLRLARAATEGDQNRAAGVFNDLKATREACPDMRAKELEQASCDALAVAQSKAQAFIANSLNDFIELTTPLHAAQAFVIKTDATCTNADPDATPVLIAAKFDQLLNIMKGQMARAEFDDTLTQRDLTMVFQMDTWCQKVELGAACDRLHDELYPDLLDALRALAFEECRANGTPLSVSQFYALGSQAKDADHFAGHARFSLAAVEADLSYCGNPSLDLKVFPTSGPDDELTDRATTLSPRVAFGNYVKNKSIEVPREGTLEISGNVGVLRCPDGSASGAELVARINGQEWRRRPASGDIFPLTSGATLRLTVDNALPSLGIDAANIDSFTVTVNREGGACSDGKQAVLDAPFTLFEVKVNLPAAVASTDSISAGSYHTCALTTVGAVKCWGYNGSGALGNGSTIDSSTPVAVTGLTSQVKAITVGDNHSCALTPAGRVKCWGFNPEGQLGDGSTNQRNTPVDVVGLASGVKAISAGLQHTCALTNVGGVKCWGSNAYGQLGNGSTTYSSTPVDVSGLASGVQAISLGRTHSCALTTAGAVRCWGINDFGQLGIDSFLDINSTPVGVTGLASGVKAITLGSYHSCALTNAGGVKCWGLNAGGVLANGNTTTRISTPADVTGLGSGVTAIGAGNSSTCAVTSAGGARCWGFNAYGQLGNASTVDSTVPVAVTGLASGVLAMEVGEYHACVKTSSGGIKCWGRNFVGQLGNGTTSDRTTPVDVVGFP